MAAFSSIFVSLLSISVICNAGWEESCEYLIEENSGIYPFDVAGYSNIVIPTRAYSMGYCNYIRNPSDGLDLFYKYECDADRDEVTVSLYQGEDACTDGNNKVTYTYTRENNPNAQWNCGAEDCTLAISRWYNSGLANDDCSSIRSTPGPNDQLNSYGVVNGACTPAVDFGSDYNLQLSCEDASGFTQIITGSDQWECTEYGFTLDIPTDTCPSFSNDTSAIGEFQYEVHSCNLVPMDSTTTFYPLTTESEGCAYAKFDDLPFPWVIGEDYCHVVPFDEDPFAAYLSCYQGTVYMTMFENSTVCVGDNNTFPAAFAFGQPSSYNCRGSADQCDIIWMTYYEEVADTEMNETLNTTYEECVEMAMDNIDAGGAKFAIPIDICYSGRTLSCNDDYVLTMDIQNDTNCTDSDDTIIISDLLRGLDINNTATEVACVYAWRDDDTDVCALPDTGCYERDEWGYGIVKPCDGTCSSDSVCTTDKKKYDMDDADDSESDITCTVELDTESCECEEVWWDGDDEIVVCDGNGGTDDSGVSMLMTRTVFMMVIIASGLLI